MNAKALANKIRRELSRKAAAKKSSECKVVRLSPTKTMIGTNGYTIETTL